ncbi:helix-turn-helix transcriptional regulator [Antarcticirhabdus aurantiaca]|uniref:AraC family transcriptional regulator n=1 Tax=Antarcticirhabdus aurantiaca TaxID=2606717 RepID=A0ACD4NNL9_9HYPH|nr:AraC family transcriptional regulator [Antarcticirhabdus aurantiaca]WAJ28491.1 AraC family transcriptional regulator [Jeongeuplla avenae]
MSAHPSPERFLDPQIERLGPSLPIRCERPSDDLGIYVVEAEVTRPVRFRTEGPAAFSVAVFLCGEGVLALDGGDSLRVRAGSAVLFASDGPASGENAFAGDQSLVCVDFRYAAGFLERIGESPFSSARRLSMTASDPSSAILLGFRASPNLMRIAADVARCPLPPGLARRLSMLARGIDVLSELTRLVEAPARVAFALPAPADRRRVERARTILDEDFAGDWSIPRLAQAVGLNQRKLKQGFRDLAGLPPHAYLKEQRLQAAYRLLEAGRSVTDAASQTGFSNLSHFAKAFRQRFGIAPSTARYSDERLEPTGRSFAR